MVGKDLSGNGIKDVSLYGGLVFGESAKGVIIIVGEGRFVGIFWLGSKYNLVKKTK